MSNRKVYLVLLKRWMIFIEKGKLYFEDLEEVRSLIMVMQIGSIGILLDYGKYKRYCNGWIDSYIFWGMMWEWFVGEY